MVGFAVKGAVDAAQKYYEDNKKTVMVAAGATTVALAAAYAWRRAANAVPRSGPYPVGSLPAGARQQITFRLQQNLAAPAARRPVSRLAEIGCCFDGDCTAGRGAALRYSRLQFAFQGVTA